VVWLLEECSGLDYDIEVFKRLETMQAPPELQKLHPLGKSPIIGLQAPGRTEPIIMAESAYMFEYLCDHFATHLVPKRYQEGKDGQAGGETESWLRYKYFMHYTEGSFMALIVQQLLFNSK